MRVLDSPQQRFTYLFVRYTLMNELDSRQTTRAWYILIPSINGDVGEDLMEMMLGLKETVVQMAKVNGVRW